MHNSSVFHLASMALAVPRVARHPNRQPFRGVLTLVDVPSDRAPAGARGHRVLLTRAAAQRAIPSLLGMGLDFTSSFDGHDARRKVGIITEAEIVPLRKAKAQLSVEALGFSPALGAQRQEWVEQAFMPAFRARREGALAPEVVEERAFSPAFAVQQQRALAPEVVEERAFRPAFAAQHQRALAPASKLETGNSKLSARRVEQAFRPALTASQKTGALAPEVIAVCGFIFARDFPDVVKELRAARRTLGMSYEIADASVEDLDAKIWRLTDVTFTGAAVLRREKAAYYNTSIELSEN